MKPIHTIILDNTRRSLPFLLAFVCLILVAPATAQDDPDVTGREEKKAEKPARPAFESSWWFDGQTGTVYNKNTLEFVMQHRFGLINSGNKDLFGLYGPANIRLGLSYTPAKKLSIGFGYTKDNKIIDFNIKWNFLTQTRSNAIPLSLTYYGNMGAQLLNEENYLNNSDRYSYFNQILIMRRFNKTISAQIGPSYTHYNAVYWEEQEDGTFEHMDNDTWGINVGVRIKASSQISVMLGYDQPLTQHPINQPKGSLNIGVEIATSNHAFQFFFTNYRKIQPQENYMYSQNAIDDGAFLFGFNITRLKSF